ATDAAHKNLTIRNGAVSGWGQDGIDLTMVSISTGCLVEGVHASGNARGIVVGFASVIRRCTAVGNSGSGFSVSGSGTALEGCVPYQNTTTAYTVSGASSAIDCAAEHNFGGGLRRLGRCALHGCAGNTS